MSALVVVKTSCRHQTTQRWSVEVHTLGTALVSTSIDRLSSVRPFREQRSLLTRWSLKRRIVFGRKTQIVTCHRPPRREARDVATSYSILSANAHWHERRNFEHSYRNESQVLDAVSLVWLSDERVSDRRISWTPHLESLETINQFSSGGVSYEQEDRQWNFRPGWSLSSFGTMTELFEWNEPRILSVGPERLRIEQRVLRWNQWRRNPIECSYRFPCDRPPSPVNALDGSYQHCRRWTKPESLEKKVDQVRPHRRTIFLTSELISSMRFTSSTFTVRIQSVAWIEHLDGLWHGYG